MADHKGRFCLVRADGGAIPRAAKGLPIPKWSAGARQDGPVPGMAYTMFTTGEDAGRAG